FNQPVLSQVLAGDDVKLLSAGASFADAEVGANKLVTVNGVKLAGVDAKNYQVTVPVTTRASILAVE
ncbi:YDG domain-containing protein, partial [Acinetobacter baumannii]